MKKLLSLLCAVLLLTAALCGCDTVNKVKEYGDLMMDAIDAVNDPDGKSTYTYSGVTLTLPNTFLDFTGKEEGKDYPFFFASETTGLFGNKESKTELTESVGEYDLAGYAALIAQLNEMDAPTQVDGVWTAVYEADAGGETQTFTVVFYESGTDFWMIQAYCASEIFPEQKDNIWKCLTSITLEDN